jgi:hypothetical protein
MDGNELGITGFLWKSNSLLCNLEKASDKEFPVRVN